MNGPKQDQSVEIQAFADGNYHPKKLEISTWKKKTSRGLSPAFLLYNEIYHFTSFD
jgi:hypothetical protein